ncbi:phosphoserine phosphatase [Halorhodospira halochloris]|uniref:Phosphoserine phosphatase n=1 Tax=Halorhodospira halochloris TaxID=1052 RepID=A0A0X8X834_HALHR|nr:phosphoserine phosphatase SerB [Halorhodospira halochloris]MBK1652851.1 phosphoserine phosphatase SerB [Halorhodospira halochloris]BAU57330.1 phosphoserine phosphatase [Halorhodospira halochloris]
MSEIILINVSGEDQPGLTSSLMEILAEYNVGILDIGQAMIHDTLSLGILVEVPAQEDVSPVLKDVLFHLHDAGMQVRFTPINQEKYHHWVEGAGKPRHIITLLGRCVTAEQIARISAVVSSQGLNIEDIVRLSGRRPLHLEGRRSRACIELTVRGQPVDPDAMKRDFMEISKELDIDISFQEDNVYRRNRRMVAFDMDSTLIQQEVIDEMAKAAGAGEECSKVTEQAMRGEIDFRESLRKRVALLEGLSEETLQRVAESLTLTEGAQRLVRTVKSFGYVTAIISGGFTYFGRYLQEQLGIDYVYANDLEIQDGYLTGRVLGNIVDGPRKAELLREIAEQEGLALEQVIAIGDGANDLPMLRQAGLGIAFRAKPVVQESARQSISTLGLDGTLYLMGIKDTDTPDEDNSHH